MGDGEALRSGTASKPQRIGYLAPEYTQHSFIIRRVADKSGIGASSYYTACFVRNSLLNLEAHLEATLEQRGTYRGGDV